MKNLMQTQPQPRAARDPLALDPGELRHKITLARASQLQDAAGQLVNTWPVYRTTMASIRNLSGQELYQGNQFTSAAQWRIRIRWTGDNTTPGDRIVWQNHTYIVQIVNNVLGQGVVVELTCLEIDGSS